MPILFVFAITLIHETSLRSANVVLVLYAVELGAKPLSIGVLAAAFSVFPILLAVLAGKLADRFGARWPLMFGAGVGTLGMLVPYFVPGLPAIFVAAAAIGLFDGICVVSVQNLVGLLSTPENRARNYSNYSLIGSTAGLLGPLLAGFSIDFAGYAAACACVGLLTLVPIILLMVRDDELRGGARPATRAKGGARAMLSEPGVRRTLATSSLMAAGNNLYIFYMPVYAHAIGLSASSIGIVLAANAAAIFVVRMALPHLIKRYKEAGVLTYSFYVEAASLILIPLFQDAVALAVLSFLFGLGVGSGGPIITMLMFSSSAVGRSGEGLGLKITVNHLTKVASPVIFGAMGSAFGLFPMFWINALMMGAGGVLSRPKK